MKYKQTNVNENIDKELEEAKRINENLKKQAELARLRRENRDLRRKIQMDDNDTDTLFSY